MIKVRNAFLVVGIIIFFFGSCCADSDGYIALLIVVSGIAISSIGLIIGKFTGEDYENEK